MSKAILEFDLNNIDDRLSHLRAIKSLDMAYVLFDIQFNLRKRIRWKLEDLPDISTEDCLDLVFKEINKVFEENDVDIEKLIE